MTGRDGTYRLPQELPTPTAMPEPPSKLQVISQHLAAGRADQARIALQRLLQQSPRDATANRMMGTLLAGQGQGQQAAFFFDRAEAAGAGNPDLLLALAQSLVSVRQEDRAIAVLERAVALAPDRPEPRAMLAAHLRATTRFARAAAVCRPALDADPRHVEVWLHYAASLLCLGQVEEAVAVLRRASDRVPGDLRIAEVLACTLNYDAAATPREVFTTHVAYGAGLDRLVAPSLLPPPPPPLPPGPLQRPLRLGILSPDLRTHAVATFVEPIAANLDGSKIELTCYYTGAAEDQVSHRLRSLSSRWRHEPAEDAVRLAHQIRGDGIDILVELAGLTAGHRMATMALRPAPIQAGYIGYPNTTGVGAIDYRIVDSLTDPLGADEFVVERLVRLDPCFLCHRPPPDAPPVAPRPPCEADPQGWTTFGSAGSLLKTNQRTMHAWGTLLHAVPRSRLLLKNHCLNEPEVRDAVADRFAALGIGPERLLLLPPTPGLREHLSTYDRVDVALDTFPYVGTTTTCESLLMGVPVVSLAAGPPPSGSHAGRVGVSLLSSVGVPELITRTQEEYIALAASLAADRDRLVRYRATLRGRLLGSPLCDAPGFTRRFEAMLQRLWSEHSTVR